MNSTFSIRHLGSNGNNIYISQAHHLALLYESVATFVVAGLLAAVSGSRNALLHGELNILFMIYSQGPLTPPRAGLLGVIIGRRFSALFTVDWLYGVENRNPTTREAGHPTQLTVRDAVDEEDRVIDREDFLKSMIFPARTTHRRLFPTSHAFGYSYLLVGIPVSGTTRIESNSMLSTHPTPTPDGAAQTPRAWFSVHATDYLQRGTAFSHLTLRQKLDQYLHSEGCSPSVYPYAYLVTAPRFLGFSFNPVSFWYLYDENQTLAAMILEVNNTFDERRMYLLQRSQQRSGDVAKTGTGVVRDTLRFTRQWSKDFHVSPFNDRDGSYSVTAKNIAATDVIDNTIVLRSDEGNAKIIARVFSTKDGMDPVTMSLWSRTMFLLQWFWVGFMTNARILKEARMLWVKKLQVFYRPEPLKSTIGRNETPEEIEVEKCFRQVLSHVSKRERVVVEYFSAAGEQRGTCVRLGENDDSKDMVLMTIRVPTPELYAELAREGGSIRTLWERVFFQDTTESQRSSDPLIWTDNMDALRKLFRAREEENGKLREQLMIRHENQRLSRLELAVVLLRKKRLSVLAVVIHVLAADLGFQCSNQILSLSEMDASIKEVMRSAEYSLYLWNVLTILLCDRVAFGFQGLFTLEIRIVRLIMVTISTRLIILPLKTALNVTGSRLRSWLRIADVGR